MKSAIATAFRLGLLAAWCAVSAAHEAAAAGRDAIESEAREPTWFVVGPRDGSSAEGFLLPLTQSDAIAAARSAIAAGAAAEGGIVVASVAAGADGRNRDPFAPGTPPWSWHVREFQQFADLTIELCDGSPGLLEDDVAGFLRNTGGTICFWNYRVVAELPSAPAFDFGDAPDGLWIDPTRDSEGYFVDALRRRDYLALGWFSYAADGAPTWLTAQGAYDGRRAVLDVHRPVARGRVERIGSMTIAWNDCNEATATYHRDGEAARELRLLRAVPIARDCLRDGN